VGLWSRGSITACRRRRRERRTLADARSHSAAQGAARSAKSLSDPNATPCGDPWSPDNILGKPGTGPAVLIARTPKFAGGSAVLPPSSTRDSVRPLHEQKRPNLILHAGNPRIRRCRDVRQTIGRMRKSAHLLKPGALCGGSGPPQATWRFAPRFCLDPSDSARWRDGIPHPGE
jgi:hypothetical protein